MSSVMNHSGSGMARGGSRRKTPRAFFAAFIAAIACPALAACAMQGAIGFENLGFEISCTSGDPCGWTIGEGARYGGTWLPTDLGLEFAEPGRSVAEQRTGPFEPPTVRDYVLEATVMRPATATIVFELAWYRGAGADGGPGDFWSGAQPIRTDQVIAKQEGLYRLRQLTSVPAEAAGLVLRVIKEGSGRCWVDELRYAPLRDSNAARQ